MPQQLKYKYGSGRCPVCGRYIGATKHGRTYRHGHTRLLRFACRGSGRFLVNWLKPSRRRPFFPWPNDPK